MSINLKKTNHDIRNSKFSSFNNSQDFNYNTTSIDVSTEQSLVIVYINRYQ